MTTTTSSERLILRPTTRMSSDQPVRPLVLTPPGPFIVGRSSDADWKVPDQSVSRRHASVALSDGEWSLLDLGSRHGTTLNGTPIGSASGCAIRHGDLIGFGGWTCRCLDTSAESANTTPFSAAEPDRASISAIDRSRLAGVAQRGLTALLELSRAMDKADSEQEIAGAVIAAVQESTGCARVVVTRLISETDFEVLASTVKDAPALSRSLIDAAMANGLVELRAAVAPQDQAHSIAELNIRSAICAAIRAGSMPAAFLMLDSRGAERELPPDAAALCESVAQVAGLAFERLHNADLAARHAQLESDIGAARRAQELLMPERSGTIGRVRFVFDSSAGRVVAGDFFDIFELPSGSVAFLLGDVAGKGMGAALLMAAAQSELRAHMLAGGSLADAITLVNGDLFRRTDPSKFITLIAGVIDPVRAIIQIIDAGHGLHALLPAGGEPARINAPAGFPLGVVEHGEHETIHVPFQPGLLFVTFSDGVVEQPGDDGRQFGLDAAMDCLRGSTEPGNAVSSLVDGVRRHARGPLADDLTVAAMLIE